MKLTIKLILITLILSLTGSSYAQFTKKNSKKVGTKEKTNVSSTRHKDLQQFINQLFIIDNAMNANNKQKIIESATIIKELSKREIARTENDLIDLYNTKPQTEEIGLLTVRIQERLKKETQKYNVILDTDFNDSQNVKQAMYAHNSMKYFKGYMQDNYNEIDKPNEKKSIPSEEASKNVEKTKSSNPTGGMLSVSGSHNKSAQNQQQDQTTPNKTNPELQKYYDNKNANISSLKKIAGDLSSALLKKDTERTRKLKKDATKKIKQIIADDNTLLRRINGGDPSLKGVNPDKLNSTLELENNILKELREINPDQDQSRATQLLSNFIQLPIEF